MPCWRLLRQLQFPRISQPSLALPARGSLPCTHLKDQLNDLRMHHAMHRLPVHVGDEVTSTKPGLLGWASLFHVLGTRHPTGVESQDW